ncbi:ribonuclease III domain-containing protein [Ilyonectria robusta]|uniref:ribonuclease III domain-containing protein n=1 Tax=Ilyonectria robusta TaxID=1079257 RepID=UPI001E8E5CCD|nr:ribonuclease III domain-containing protein [Ilyonectria robusta]KAH8706264.1 ribonuclease III domain-containing protein [Ilyonectria robusta]
MDFSSGFGKMVSQCEAIIGYSFTSKVLCAEALNAAGDFKSVYVSDGLFKRMPKNDRLAVYGDSTANFYLCSLWVQRGLDKHSWTTIRRDLVGNENLARVGMEHGLGNCINVNGGTSRVTPGMVATAVEAILGAVQRDGGLDALARVMDQLGLTQHDLLSLVTFLLHPSTSLV